MAGAGLAAGLATVLEGPFALSSCTGAGGRQREGLMAWTALLAAAAACRSIHRCQAPLRRCGTAGEGCACCSPWCPGCRRERRSGQPSCVCEGSGGTNKLLNGSGEGAGSRGGGELEGESDHAWRDDGSILPAGCAQLECQVINYRQFDANSQVPALHRRPDLPPPPPETVPPADGCPCPTLQQTGFELQSPYGRTCSQLLSNADR